MSRQTLVMIIALVGLLLVSARPALACPVCFGATDSPMAAGVNNGIFFLLGIIGAVQLGFVALFVSVRRRAKSHEQRKDSFEVITGGVR